MEGGPLFKVQSRAKLFRTGATATIRRAAIFALLAWMRLLVLSVIQGMALGHAVPVPFLSDFGAYTRFLLAIPLFIAAENFLGPRIAETAAHFVASGLVVEKDYKAYSQAIDLRIKEPRLRLAEIVIAILAYVISFSAYRTTSLHVSTWHAIRTDTGFTLTMAGWWLLYLACHCCSFCFFVGYGGYSSGFNSSGACIILISNSFRLIRTTLAA